VQAEREEVRKRQQRGMRGRQELPLQRKESSRPLQHINKQAFLLSPRGSTSCLRKSR